MVRVPPPHVAVHCVHMPVFRHSNVVGGDGATGQDCVLHERVTCGLFTVHKVESTKFDPCLQTYPIDCSPVPQLFVQADQTPVSVHKGLGAGTCAGTGEGTGEGLGVEGTEGAGAETGEGVGASDEGTGEGPEEGTGEGAEGTEAGAEPTGEGEALFFVESTYNQPAYARAATTRQHKHKTIIKSIIPY